MSSQLSERDKLFRAFRRLVYLFLFLLLLILFVPFVLQLGALAIIWATRGH